jgi:hypothetical protein
MFKYNIVGEVDAAIPRDFEARGPGQNVEALVSPFKAGRRTAARQSQQKKTM